jgi:ketosteroid isomerase-like protein
LAAAGRWAREWERAWREHDAAAVAALYADGADFRSSPFREPRVGPAGAGAYAEWAFTDEEPGADVRFGEPRVAADDRATVEYWAVVREPDGEVTIAGVSLLRFDDEGLVVEQRDYWNQARGRRQPPPGWGR